MSCVYFCVHLLAQYLALRSWRGGWKPLPSLSSFSVNTIEPVMERNHLLSNRDLLLGIWIAATPCFPFLTQKRSRYPCQVTRMAESGWYSVVIVRELAYPAPPSPCHVMVRSILCSSKSPKFFPGPGLVEKGKRMRATRALTSLLNPGKRNMMTPRGGHRVVR